MSSSKSNIVVKTNRLNTALQNLTLTEIRLVQLAIVDARETGTGLSTDTPLRITAMRYAEVFDTTRQNAYKRLQEAEENLFNRRFTYIDEDGKPVKSRWIQQAKYLDVEGTIEIVFTLAVVRGISRIDGVEDFFTSYLLEQTTAMTSNYSVRLYELLVQWKKTKKTPVFELQKFREQLGIGVDEYQRMGNFKSRVLDLAIKEINEYTDFKVTYEQVKKGRVITGFKFEIKEKTKPKKQESNRDKDTVDMFGAFSMTDKQRQYYGRKLADIHELSDRAKGQSGQCYNAFGRQIADELLQEKNRQFYKPHLAKIGFVFKD